MSKEASAAIRDTSFVPQSDLGDCGTIGSLHFGQIGNDLLLSAACFNTGMNLFRVAPTGRSSGQAFQSQRIMQKETPTPVLTTQIDPQNSMVLGGLCDGTIQAWLPATNQMTAIGQHSDMCTHIRTAPQFSCLISSGYDGFVKYWDVRTPQCQGQVQCGGRILAMDYNENLIAVALENQVVTIDIRKPTQLMNPIPSGLAESHVGICTMHKNEGYVVYSLDSRAKVEFLGESSRSFPFRAHRIDQTGSSDAFTFSATACHPQYNTLVTCGCDGTWSTWDFYEKQRLLTSERYPLPISAAAFSPDGSIFAFASSYNWFRGANGDPSKSSNQNNSTNYSPRIGFYSLGTNQLKFSKGR